MRDGIVTPVPSAAVRYAPYQREVAATPEHAFVFPRRLYELSPIRGALVRNAYRWKLVGPFEVWVPPGRH